MMNGRIGRVILCTTLLLAFLISCQARQAHPDASSRPAEPVTLCDLAQSGDRYNGKIVQVRAIIASLEKGPYLFTDHCDRYYMPLLEVNGADALSPDLKKVWDISRSKPETVTPMEADVVVTGKFDSQYKREGPLDEVFRYRIMITHIEQVSPLRRLRRLGAA